LPRNVIFGFSMKPESHFPKLPSVSELLQHPAVEKVVDRMNQSTIAQRATGFLAELQTSWRDASVGSVMPSLGQMAEGLAQRLMGKPDHAAPVINATGEICSPRWQAPLADAAVQEMLRLAGEFHEPASSLQQQASALLCELTGAESAWVVSSYRVATRLVQDTEAELAQYAGLIDPLEFGLLAVPTLTARVTARAELVVCDGAGLLGGPSCGIIVGRRAAVERLQQQPWSDVVGAESLPLVALVSTLSTYRMPGQVIHRIPIWQLLSAPRKNLQQRCERLATLIAESDTVAEAVPTSSKSTWYVSDSMQLAGPTWAIRLLPDGQSLEQFVLSLEKSVPTVVAHIADNAVWLDLRSVFPRWDQQLVAAMQSTA
jgi:hypothetical protein